MNRTSTLVDKLQFEIGLSTFLISLGISSMSQGNDNGLVHTIIELINGAGTGVIASSVGHFVNKGAERIIHNTRVNEHIEHAILESLRFAIKDIKEDWVKDNPKDECDIDNFLYSITGLNRDRFKEKFFEQFDDIKDVFSLIEKNTENGVLVFDSVLKIRANRDTLKEKFGVSDQVIDYFTKHLFEKFNYHFRVEIKKGGEAKNAMDLLYQETTRALLLELGQGQEAQNATLEKIEQGLTTLLQQSKAKEGSKDELQQWFESALKKVVSSKHDEILKHVNPQPTLITDFDLIDKPAIFRERYLTFVKRDSIWKELQDFYDSPKKFEWWLVTAPGGTGKSRLALEFCIELKELSAQPISAGFIADDALKRYEWHNRTPVRPWVIVVDYTGSRKEEVLAAMEHFRDKKDEYNHPVRLLLLDRTTPEWLLEKNNSDNSELLADVKGGKVRAFKPKPIALEITNEQERKQHAQKVFEQTLTKANEKSPTASTKTAAQQNELIETVLKRIDPQLRPLFVFIYAKAVAEGNKTSTWNQNELLDYWLNHHEYPIWKNYLETHDSAANLEQYKNLAALITMMYGMSSNIKEGQTKTEAKQIFDSKLEYLPPSINTAKKNYAKAFYGLDNGIWKPLEPDILGEYFVQQHLQIAGADDDEKEEKIALRTHLINLAWQTNPTGTKDFAYRYFQDYQLNREQEDPLFIALLNPTCTADSFSELLSEACNEIATTYVDANRYTLTDLKYITKLKALTRLDLNDCIQLRSLSLPIELTALTMLYLNGCTQLSSLSLPEELTALTYLYLWDCTQLSSLSLPKELTALTYLTLWDCTKLSSLSLPKELTALTSLNLSRCTKLSSLSLPKELTALTSLNLSRCTQLKDFSFLEELTALTSLDLSGCTQLSSLSLPKELTALTYLYLWDCTKLSSLSLPKELTALTYLTLWDCTQLSSLSLPKELTALTRLDLSDCTQLSSLTLPEELTALTSLYLNGCTLLSNKNIDAIATAHPNATVYREP